MKVIIADDQTLVRESLSIILAAHEDIDVIGTASNGKEVLKLLSKKLPDVILMDIRMPEMDGVLCTKEVKERYPSVKIIILTTFDDDEYIYSALKYGASGYVLKGVSTEELYHAILTVNKGGAMINPNVATKVVKLFSQMAQSNYTISVPKDIVDSLSEVEWKLIQQVSCGYTNKEIANNMYLSEGTIRNYLSIVLSKLHLRDRTQLAIWAVQTGVNLSDYPNVEEKEGEVGYD
ncbi:DNA-binding response regulator [Atopobacter sp. AH10]|uniref:response regulator transcription factor n=1 Tax=Atopobacter sp. AH10 TaxID=2315861 RepID=UPI000EF22F7E|nr:response regulator transcription factor [Atopobacter sp. AH10]RLK64232.1 DNA-binding response regulator [Atopobacter sp. AH10]